MKPRYNHKYHNKHISARRLKYLQKKQNNKKNISHFRNVPPNREHQSFPRDYRRPRRSDRRPPRNYRRHHNNYIYNTQSEYRDKTYEGPWYYYYNPYYWWYLNSPYMAKDDDTNNTTYSTKVAKLSNKVEQLKQNNIKLQNTHNTALTVGGIALLGVGVYYLLKKL